MGNFPTSPLITENVPPVFALDVQQYRPRYCIVKGGGSGPWSAPCNPTTVPFLAWCPHQSDYLKNLLGRRLWHTKSYTASCQQLCHISSQSPPKTQLTALMSAPSFPKWVLNFLQLESVKIRTFIPQFASDFLGSVVTHADRLNMIPGFSPDHPIRNFRPKIPGAWPLRKIPGSGFCSALGVSAAVSLYTEHTACRDCSGVYFDI